jgi:hypothetical protein
VFVLRGCMYVCMWLRSVLSASGCDQRTFEFASKGLRLNVCTLLADVIVATLQTSDIKHGTDTTCESTMCERTPSVDKNKQTNKTTARIYVHVRARYIPLRGRCSHVPD